MSTNEKLVPGMVLGRYELLLPIAQGGMATVGCAAEGFARVSEDGRDQDDAAEPLG